MNENLQDFVNRCQVILTDHQKKQFSTTYETHKQTLKIIKGRKYSKIVIVNANAENQSVYAFVDSDGNVYKPASWEKPAKHARGNINDKNYVCGPYGPEYLR